MKLSVECASEKMLKIGQ